MRAWETGGLFVAWAIHDAEEWVTMARWARRRLADPDTPAWLKRLPAVQSGISDLRVRAAIAVMGGIVGSTALHGLRTRGRSTLFRCGVLAFSVHGLGHVTASVVLRSDTPGVATTPVTVLPYAVWTLRRAHVQAPLGSREVALAVALLPASLAVSHAVGRLVDPWLAARVRV